jgi:hypothetical protein
MENPSRTFDSFCDFIKSSVESVGTTLKPDDDWVPVLWAASAEGKVGLFAIPQMGDPDSKDAAAAIIPIVIGEFKPKIAALVMTAWSKHYDASDPIKHAAELARDEAKAGGFGRLEPLDDKCEIVCVWVFDQDGNERGLVADITRYPTLHPVLSWRQDMDGATATGRFPEAMRAGFALARGGARDA